MRFKQRMTRRYSDTTAPGNIRHRQFINDLNIDPTQTTTLASLNARGLWQSNVGITTFDQPFDPAVFGVDGSGHLVADKQTQTQFGEYYTGIPTDYPIAVQASRALRSDVLIEYQLLGGIQDGTNGIFILPFTPATGPWGSVLNFVVEVAGARNSLIEATIAPGGVGTAFVSERDGVSNKILISARRVNANSKDFVCTWYDRSAGAVATATVNWAGGGFGDEPLMWRFTVPGSGGLPSGGQFLLKSLQISDSPIAYGAMPV
jgi:hypothetical protein